MLWTGRKKKQGIRGEREKKQREDISVIKVSGNKMRCVKRSRS